MKLTELASALSIPPSKVEAFGLFLTTLVCLVFFAKTQDPSGATKHLLTPLEDVADEKLEFNKMFNNGMVSDSELVGDVVMMTCRDMFKGLKSLVEVGGGTGPMARAITHVFPEIKCIVLDLPHEINTVKEHICLVEYVSGDMFVSVPLANATLLMDNF
ncbi:tabersonine 16-O-methyltransferase-like [Dioscorea cayenensis subsp. rotundata]|uniref:Tabersonine 16-O-methyltransferase-like n=1 Tax=Dioscorea cayennensis subsp. rotundata TaxID=55577 RepID=A0AB40C3E5_DIOCR|nr:tabersonine 16-O-methyltransferase-like [Dioscorea cayenensis subsp. rotundata]